MSDFMAMMARRRQMSETNVKASAALNDKSADDDNKSSSKPAFSKPSFSKQTSTPAISSTTESNPFKQQAKGKWSSNRNFNTTTANPSPIPENATGSQQSEMQSVLNRRRQLESSSDSTAEAAKKTAGAKPSGGLSSELEARMNFQRNKTTISSPNNSNHRNWSSNHGGDHSESAASLVSTSGSEDEADNKSPKPAWQRKASAANKAAASLPETEEEAQGKFNWRANLKKRNAEAKSLPPKSPPPSTNLKSVEPEKETEPTQQPPPPEEETPAEEELPLAAAAAAAASSEPKQDDDLDSYLSGALAFLAASEERSASGIPESVPAEKPKKKKKEKSPKEQQSQRKLDKEKSCTELIDDLDSRLAAAEKLSASASRRRLMEEDDADNATPSFNIFILNTALGKTMQISVTEQDTVQVLKTRIRYQMTQDQKAETGHQHSSFLTILEESEQRLIFNGHELKNPRQRLSECKIVRGSSLLLQSKSKSKEEKLKVAAAGACAAVIGGAAVAAAMGSDSNAGEESDESDEDSVSDEMPLLSDHSDLEVSEVSVDEFQLADHPSFMDFNPKLGLNVASYEKSAESGDDEEEMSEPTKEIATSRSIGGSTNDEVVIAPPDVTEEEEASAPSNQYLSVSGHSMKESELEASGRKKGKKHDELADSFHSVGKVKYAPSAHPIDIDSSTSHHAAPFHDDETETEFDFISSDNEEEEAPGELLKSSFYNGKLSTSHNSADEDAEDEALRPSLRKGDSHESGATTSSGDYASSSSETEGSSGDDDSSSSGESSSAATGSADDESSADGESVEENKKVAAGAGIAALAAAAVAEHHDDAEVESRVSDEDADAGGSSEDEQAAAVAANMPQHAPPPPPPHRPPSPKKSKAQKSDDESDSESESEGGWSTGADDSTFRESDDDLQVRYTYNSAGQRVPVGKADAKTSTQSSNQPMLQRDAATEEQDDTETITFGDDYDSRYGDFDDETLSFLDHSQATFDRGEDEDDGYAVEETLRESSDDDRPSRRNRKRGDRDSSSGSSDEERTKIYNVGYDDFNSLEGSNPSATRGVDLHLKQRQPSISSYRDPDESEEGITEIVIVDEDGKEHQVAAHEYYESSTVGSSSEPYQDAYDDGSTIYTQESSAFGSSEPGSVERHLRDRELDSFEQHRLSEKERLEEEKEKREDEEDERSTAAPALIAGAAAVGAVGVAAAIAANTDEEENKEEVVELANVAAEPPIEPASLDAETQHVKNSAGDGALDEETQHVRNGTAVAAPGSAPIGDVSEKPHGVDDYTEGSFEEQTVNEEEDVTGFATDDDDAYTEVEYITDQDTDEEFSADGDRGSALDGSPMDGVAETDDDHDDTFVEEVVTTDDEYEEIDEYYGSSDNDVYDDVGDTDIEDVLASGNTRVVEEEIVTDDEGDDEDTLGPAKLTSVGSLLSHVSEVTDEDETDTEREPVSRMAPAPIIQQDSDDEDLADDDRQMELNSRDVGVDEDDGAGQAGLANKPPEIPERKDGIPGDEKNRDDDDVQPGAVDESQETRAIPMAGDGSQRQPEVERGSEDEFEEEEKEEANQDAAAVAVAAATAGVAAGVVASELMDDDEPENEVESAATDAHPDRKGGENLEEQTAASVAASEPEPRQQGEEEVSQHPNEAASIAAAAPPHDAGDAHQHETSAVTSSPTQHCEDHSMDLPSDEEEVVTAGNVAAEPPQGNQARCLDLPSDEEVETANHPEAEDAGNVAPNSTEEDHMPFSQALDTDMVSNEEQPQGDQESARLAPAINPADEGLRDEPEAVHADARDAQNGEFDDDDVSLDIYNEDADARDAQNGEFDDDDVSLDIYNEDSNDGSELGNVAARLPSSPEDERASDTATAAAAVSSDHDSKREISLEAENTLPPERDDDDIGIDEDSQQSQGDGKAIAAVATAAAVGATAAAIAAKDDEEEVDGNEVGEEGVDASESRCLPLVDEREAGASSPNESDEGENTARNLAINDSEDTTENAEVEIEMSRNIADRDSGAEGDDSSGGGDSDTTFRDDGRTPGLTGTDTDTDFETDEEDLSFSMGSTSLVEDDGRTDDDYAKTDDEEADVSFSKTADDRLGKAVADDEGYDVSSDKSTGNVANESDEDGVMLLKNEAPGMPPVEQDDDDDTNREADDGHGAPSELVKYGGDDPPELDDGQDPPEDRERVFGAAAAASPPDVEDVSSSEEFGGDDVNYAANMPRQEPPLNPDDPPEKDPIDPSTSFRKPYNENDDEISEIDLEAAENMERPESAIIPFEDEIDKSKLDPPAYGTDDRDEDEYSEGHYEGPDLEAQMGDDDEKDRLLKEKEPEEEEGGMTSEMAMLALGSFVCLAAGCSGGIIGALMYSGEWQL